MNSSEKKASKIVDFDLFNAFSYFRNVQMLLGSCRINSKNGILTPPTIYQKAYTVVLGMTLTVCYWALEKVNFYEYEARSHDLYLYGTIVTFLHFSAYVLNLIHVRFFNSDENTKFIMTMQELDVCMKLYKVRVINCQLCTLSKIKVIVFVCAFFILISMSLLDGRIRVIFLVFILSFTDITFMLELVFCSNIMAYFAIRMRIVNSIINNYLDRDPIDNKRYTTFSKKYIRKVVKESHNFTCDDTYLYLKEILKSFSEFQCLYQFQVTTKIY